MMNEQIPAVSPSPYAGLIKAAHQFLGNTTLKGVEVEAYAQTFNWLQSILVGELVVLPVDVYKTLTDTVDAHAARLVEDKALEELKAEAAVQEEVDRIAAEVEVAAEYVVPELKNFPYEIINDPEEELDPEELEDVESKTGKIE